MTGDNETALRESLGLSKEDADMLDKMSQKTPAFKIPKDGTKVFGTFTSDELRRVEVHDENAKFGPKDRTVLITEVKDDEGVAYSLWINPKSILAREYYRVLKQAGGSLANKRCAFWKEKIPVAKYGDVLATRIQLVESQKDIKKLLEV